MRIRFPVLLVVLAAVAFGCGCVERRLVIRSEPPGAPVWVDEQYAGQTPLEHDFVHYGPRRIRVGPVRDDAERMTHLARERVVEVKAPWYQTFPIDFFYEVLWPETLVDLHEVPTFVLTPIEERPGPRGQERFDFVREQAEQFRKEALESIPEPSPARLPE